MAKKLIIFDHDGTLVFTEKPEFSLFPGIKELLVDLEQSGFSLAVWTARPRSSTLRSLKQLEIASFFGELYCSDDGPGKPHPMGLLKVSHGFEKENILHIGDSLSDIEGARSFGIEVIAACWNSTFQVETFKQKTPHVALKVGDCKKIISEKFKLDI
jgi:phosphoglycolate phosphatase